ncbi:radical SAM family heme chaperone HemW [Raineya orbicola]|nr:radical SAM family heme chaperone HemW [Raineya orbicola]
MSALYLHIPFCKQACHYCDFHFSTQIAQKENMVKAICQEIALQKDYLQNKTLQSVYFGGGTPSLLSKQDLEKIFEQIQRFFALTPQTEITLEANPDDLTLEKLHILRKVGINRLSIGVQSFHQPHLIFLHRSHTALQAENCVKIAQDVGFSNITIDLIYAIPAENHHIWEQDLQKALSLNVPHISAYCLTIEPRTVFGKKLEKRKMQPIDETFAREQMQILISTLTSAGFEHYEISNFARKGFYSKHNSNYWLGGEYLGIGASAHSYNGESRQYNIADNKSYIAEIFAGKIPATIEQLSPKEKLNEYLLTSLRTQWGAEKSRIQALEPNFFRENRDLLQRFEKQNLIFWNDERIYLTHEGKFFADQIAADLFWV